MCLDKRRHYVLGKDMVVRLLQRSPVLRSVVYLTGAAAMLQTVTSLYGRESDVGQHAIHLTALPFVTAWTYRFVALRKDDWACWTTLSLRQGSVQAAIGMALGAGAFLTVVSTAMAQGWVHLPAWGWERRSKVAVVRTLLLLAGDHGAVAWNEELVFRGYGLNTVTAAVGQPAAVLGLTALFARAHGTDLQMFIGQGALGLALMALRLRTGALWLPIGYHFAWNYLQTAILGPPDALPSLRPMYLHGPELWLGRPGYPEPGLLSTFVHLSVALIAAWDGWRRKRDR